MSTPAISLRQLRYLGGTILLILALPHSCWAQAPVRAIKVQHLKPSDGIQDCQILFIGAAENKRAAGILADAKGSAILTVGESQAFAEDGGMIEFCLKENKIRFEINLSAVGTAKLKMSARLLALAKTVIGTPGEN